MSGYIRLPRNSSEQDRLLIGDDLYSVSSNGRPKKRSSMHTALRSFMTFLSFAMVVLAGVDTAFGSRSDGFNYVFAVACFALSANIAHLTYDPLISNLLEALKEARGSSVTINNSHRRWTLIGRISDGILSFMLFVAAVLAFAITKTYRGFYALRLASGLIAFLLFVLMILPSTRCARMRIKVSFDESSPVSPAQSTRAPSSHGIEVRDNTRMSPTPIEQTPEIHQEGAPLAKE